MAIKSDAQAKRSRQWLTEALLELMETQTFQNISVTAVADKALLDRRTFYRHFKTKEEVICYKLQELTDEYEKIFERHGEISTREIALAFFEICKEHEKLLLLLHRHKLLPLVLDELSKIFPRFHYKYHIEPELYTALEVDGRYALAYHIGGFWNVLVQWAEDGCAKTPEELSILLGRILPETI